ncbi:MAG: hypothetical protein NBKEAIPA_00058 [Nitrospirae bacterium]|nr:MAG: SnoaL-like domain protein [Nitrospira sp. OLB3]MBV6468195.1 hypothetical protein [Nitrospirota bacterium]
MTKETIHAADYRSVRPSFRAGVVNAWNAHNIDRVLAHYADDCEFRSPLIINIANEPSGRLTGKPAIRAYWAAALQKLPDLRFELLDVLTGADCLTLHYRGHRGPVAETFFFNGSGKVIRAAACYSVGL